MIYFQIKTNQLKYVFTIIKPESVLVILEQAIIFKFISDIITLSWYAFQIKTNKNIVKRRLYNMFL